MIHTSVTDGPKNAGSNPSLGLRSSYPKFKPKGVRMPLLPTDEDNLKNWSLYSDYNRQRKKLVDLARVVYRNSTGALLAGQQVPGGLNPDDFVAMYIEALNRLGILDRMFQTKLQIKFSDHAGCAIVLARYVLHSNWPAITS